MPGFKLGRSVKWAVCVLPAIFQFDIARPPFGTQGIIGLKNAIFPSKARSAITLVAKENKLKIRLRDWLAQEFSPAPAMRTASRWIKEGKIYPPPIKVGNAYYVEKNAVYQENARPRLIHRIA
ncbi:excisionase [Burkholderia ubonensis]|uniref:excisionase n=1 Tax=Burkholderia ubonensis TaxID=101571 RepID=UPI0022B764FA|nr:excisionase [Burkholderia ubonensis]